MKKSYLLFQFIMAFLLSIVSMGVFGQNQKSSEWKAPEEAISIENPFKNDADATKAGKKLYRQQCAVCHGDTGKGDGVAGLALTPKPASFKSEKFQAETDGAVYWKITNGRPPMASYKDILTEDQRWQLINYIRTFSK